MSPLAPADRTFRVLTYGCQMNRADTQAMGSLLAADGYTRVDGDDAAVVIVNSCAIREDAEAEVFTPTLALAGACRRCFSEV